MIGDGSWYNHNSAKSVVTNLLNQHKIKTFTVAYGGGIGSSGIRNFKAMAQAGGTNDVIIANTTASLKAQLKAAEIAKKAYKENLPIIEVALAETNLTRTQLNKYLDPKKLIKGGIK